MHRDVLYRSRGIASVVGCSDGACNGVVACRVARRDQVGERHSDRTAAVRGRGGHERQTIRALHKGVLRKACKCWRRGVLHGDGLRGRIAVARIVGGREGAGDDVVARGIARRGDARNFHGHRAAQVHGSGILHGHVVCAFDGVVCGNQCEFRRRGVHDADGLRGRAAVAGIVGCCECAGHSVVACGVARGGHA